MKSTSRHYGFSLVELSIVLVILGLLTGGILAGQSLIRASELRAVSTEYQRNIAAVQSFRDKYMALPGDMTNSVGFWSRQVNQAWCLPTSGASVASPGTCNGNGDGVFENAPAGSQSGEKFQFWRQLALAGLIEGTYTGYSESGGTSASLVGTNVPTSKISNAGWGIQNPAASTTNYSLDYGVNSFIFGTQTAGNNSPESAALRPEEAWNIDTKLDDGRPAYGKVVARYWNNACATGGATNADRSTSVYNLTSSSIACALYFINING